MCLLLQVTPGQLQYCAESFLHEAMAPVVPERWSFRQSSAWRSVSDVLRSGAVGAEEDATERKQDKHASMMATSTGKPGVPAFADAIYLPRWIAALVLVFFSYFDCKPQLWYLGGYGT